VEAALADSRNRIIYLTQGHKSFEMRHHYLKVESKDRRSARSSGQGAYYYKGTEEFKILSILRKTKKNIM